MIHTKKTKYKMKNTYLIEFDEDTQIKMNRTIKRRLDIEEGVSFNRTRIHKNKKKFDRKKLKNNFEFDNNF